MWAPDGRELFYYADAAQRLMVVPVTTSGATFTRGAAKDLSKQPLSSQYSVARSTSARTAGENYLLIREDGALGDASTARRIVFVQNWDQELKRLVPTK